MHSPFSFLIFVMRTLFFAVLILGIFRTPLNSSRILSMSCCLFILFFSLIHFFMFLLRSFSRCFSSLGMLLLSSMSLRISASLSRHSSFFFAAADVVSCISLLSFSNTLELLLFCNTIEPASSTWCVICAPRCSSGLRSGCSSPSGRCFGSRSPARRSQPLLQPVFVMISCASSSLPVLTSGCGRVLSRSLHFFSSSLPRGVDVHPSGRLCSR